MLCRGPSGWRSRWERMASGTAHLLCLFHMVPSCCLPRLPTCLFRCLPGSLGTSPMIRSYDMGYISTRMMECEDAFSDMGSLKQNLELPPEYAYDDGKSVCMPACVSQRLSLIRYLTSLPWCCR